MTLQLNISRSLLSVLLVGTSLVACNFASAQESTQQPPDNPQGTQSKPDSTDQSAPTDSTSVDHPAVVASTPSPVRQVDGAGFVSMPISPFRLGPLYLRSAQYAQVFSSGTSTNGAGDFQHTASQFSAGIVLDKRIRGVQLVLQYVPRATVYNGEVYANFLNQDVGANLVFALSPRLTLNLGNHFVYYHSNDSFVDIFLDSDPVSGTTLQKDFIQGPASWLSNSTTAAFTYLVSARTRIGVTPTYIYATSSGQATATTFPSVREYGVTAYVSHDLTPRSAVTATYVEQTDIFAQSSFHTVYQTIEGGYSRSFNGGWGISGNLGFITAKFQSGRTWSESASASIVKNFRRSRAALAYFRGHAFSGYISQQFSDRIDLSYQQNIGRRLAVTGSAGYLRDVQPVTGIWGKYLQGNVSFGLTPTLSLFSNYVHKWQRGDNEQVFTGTTDFLRFGIQWVPRQASR
jgi:hypothetical protein